MSFFKNTTCFSTFEYEVKRKNRYIYSDEAKFFLESFITMARNYEAKIKQNTTLYRSQRGYTWKSLRDEHGEEIDQLPAAFLPERMKPSSDKAKEGRVNPKGIPCLYLCNKKETAIAESRPWFGDLISFGYFKILRDLKCVHFTQKEKSPKIYLTAPPEDEIDSIVWEEINGAFSRPISPDDKTADYVPTQVLAELIKREGYDGVIYRSRLDNGLNVALFDLNVAALQACTLFAVRKVNYSFEEVDNPYYIKGIKIPDSTSAPFDTNKKS